MRDWNQELEKKISNSQSLSFSMYFSLQMSSVCLNLYMAGQGHTSDLELT